MHETNAQLSKCHLPRLLFDDKLDIYGAISIIRYSETADGMVVM